MKVEKLVEIHVEVNEIGVRIERTELTVTKETEKMIMVKGNWRQRIDKSQLGIKLRDKNYHYVCFEGIIPLEEEEEAMFNIKKDATEHIWNMSQTLALVMQQVKKWNKEDN